jgi:hypothetical protein
MAFPACEWQETGEKEADLRLVFIIVLLYTKGRF